MDSFRANTESEMTGTEGWRNAVLKVRLLSSETERKASFSFEKQNGNRRRIQGWLVMMP